jgi:hypothetical protein
MSELQQHIEGLEQDFAKCREELAAAEAREQEAIALLRPWPVMWDWNDKEAVERVLDEERPHAALDAALGQARAEERERCERILQARINAIPAPPDDDRPSILQTIRVELQRVLADIHDKGENE